MERKKIITLMALLTALLLPLALSVSAAVEENVWTYEGYFEDYIAVEVTTPAQAYPGDKIKIEVWVEAQEDLEDVVVDVRVLGTKKNGTVSWESSWQYGVIDVSPLDSGDDDSDDCDITIPTDVDPGVICGYIYCEFYDVTDDETYYFETGFPITYLLSKAYENLKADYAKLQAENAKLKANYTDITTKYTTLQTTYNTLKSDYDSLTATYTSLKSTYDSLKSENDKLKSDYSALQTKYTTLDTANKKLQGDYTSLESTYKTTSSELSSYTTYTYILAVTTIVFVITTILFALRRSKTA